MKIQLVDKFKYLQLLICVVNNFKYFQLLKKKDEKKKQNKLITQPKFQGLGWVEYLF